MMTTSNLNLSTRERTVLKVLIDHYIATAEPVGSRVLAQKSGLSLSAATIRNTMKDLEEMGLVCQPHPSAGRIPTDDGYRVFVDKLVSPQDVPGAVGDELRGAIQTEGMRAVDNVLAQTAHVLAKVTNQLGLTLAPRFNRGQLERIELVQLSSEKLLVILSIRSGLARTLLIEIDSGIDERALDETRRVLNERFAGQSISELRNSMAERLADVQVGDPKLIRMFLESADEMIASEQAGSIHVDGTVNLVAQPEFQDHASLAQIMTVIENRRQLIELLKSKRLGQGIVVTIGDEADVEGVSDCSLVTASYNAGEVQGTIGIIGPKRMDYARLLSIVDLTAKLLSEQLGKKS